METRIVIVGGGFLGIAAALRLARKRMPKTKITLVSDRPHFEYHGALYRLAMGGSPIEICIPLREVFQGLDVDVVEDRITTLDEEHKLVGGESGSRYRYDHLVLALGAETNYFGIPGLKEHAFGMKTIVEALQLNRHIRQTLSTCSSLDKEDQACAANFVVVGGGPTGMEVAGDLIIYARNLAAQQGMDPHMVNVELIEGAPRVLPQFPEHFSRRIEHHLRGLGVNIFTNRTIEKEEVESVYLKDMQLKTKTVIWTAGVQANHLFKEWGFPVDARGRVEVDAQFQAKGKTDVYLGGDAASNVKYWGMAQTAHAHGEFIADVIAAKIQQRRIPTFVAKPPIYAIPSGERWAGVMWGKIIAYGKLGWFLRRLVDFVVFNWMLPPTKAWSLLRTGKSICDTCSVCSVEPVKK
jgi:NADH dehydrogenase